MADEAEKRLGKMRQAMVKLRREGRVPEFEVLAEAYAVLKRERMEQAEREHMEAVRARRAVREVVRASEGPKVWRRPRGFASPLAAERARTGWQERREPVRPARGVSPWREVAPGERQIWP